MKIVFATDELVQDDTKDGAILLHKDVDMVHRWLREEWENRVIVNEHHPLADPVTLELSEISGVHLNVLDDPYGPGLEQSARYVYDTVNFLITDLTRGRVWVQMVEIWEHEGTTASYGYFPQ